MRTTKSSFEHIYIAISECGVEQAGDASGTGLFDTANRKFDEARMRTIDHRLPEFFPELIGPNEVRPRQTIAPEAPDRA